MVPDREVVPDRAGSLEQTFRHSYARLVSSLSLVGGREAAEDAVQEAFARASRHWWRIRNYERPEAWIRRVAINQLLTAKRSEARRDALRAVLSTPPAGASRIECGVDVRRALHHLPPRQRLYLVLQQVEQMRIHEIAEAAGVAEGTVKSGLHDARQKMLNSLGADYEA